MKHCGEASTDQSKPKEAFNFSSSDVNFNRTITLQRLKTRTFLTVFFSLPGFLLDWPSVRRLWLSTWRQNAWPSLDSTSFPLQTCLTFCLTETSPLRYGLNAKPGDKSGTSDVLTSYGSFKIL